MEKNFRQNLLVHEFWLKKHKQGKKGITILWKQKSNALAESSNASKKNRSNKISLFQDTHFFSNLFNVVNSFICEMFENWMQNVIKSLV